VSGTYFDFLLEEANGPPLLDDFLKLHPTFPPWDTASKMSVIPLLP
jgi:hypothetical protein